jgi:hypothetical protein
MRKKIIKDVLYALLAFCGFSPDLKRCGLVLTVMSARSASLTAPLALRLPAWLTRDTLPLWLGLMVFAAGLWPPALMNDSDTLWHLSAGQYMRDHGHVLTRDPFSFSFYDQPWHTHEWLSEILMSLTYQAMGWPGLMALSAVCVALTVFICARYAQRWLSGLALGLTLLLGLSLIGPHYLIRPHLLVLPLMAGLLSGLMRTREKGKNPPMALALIFLAWANMHASFIFGLGLIGFFGLEAIMAVSGSARLKAAIRWGQLLALSLLTCLMTPQGVDGFIFPFKLIFMPGIDGIAEWAPADLTRPTPLLIALAAGAYGVVRFKVRVPLWRAGLLLALTTLSLAHARYEMILGIVAVFILSEPLARSLGAPDARTEPKGARTSLKAARVVACLGLAVFALRLSVPAAEPATPLHPREALMSVPASLRTQAVLNDYDFGGFLIAEGVRPFIDGRADMYGADFLKAYDKIMAADARALGQALDTRGIQWTLLKRQSYTAEQLAALNGWHQVYADANVIIHARNPPQAGRKTLPPLAPLRKP